MLKRSDYDLPFLLRYENVAWYENGQVRILDRRIYPEVAFVVCKSYTEVVKAIQDMVTQSAGPYTAAGMGMALAAYECQGFPCDKQLAFLKKAAYEIGNARPTTANRMSIITEKAYKRAEEAIANKEDAVEAIVNLTVESLNRRYDTMNIVGQYLLSVIPDNAGVLTQCFGETIIGMLLRGAKEQNKTLRMYCAETRPYFQGSRLTASCCVDMGFETTVLTDNMILYAMDQGLIDIYTSAADSIARDGHIANKIGTKQIALLASHKNIPYFVTGIPDLEKKNADDIIIENRDASLVKNYRGVKLAMEEANAIYPSFDITGPRLISGIVTDKGIFSPYNLNAYFDFELKEFY